MGQRRWERKIVAAIPNGPSTYFVDEFAGMGGVGDRRFNVF